MSVVTSRTAVIAAPLLVLAMSVEMAGAQEENDQRESPIEVRGRRARGSVLHEVTGETPGSEAPASQPGRRVRRVASGPRAPVYYAEFPRVDTQPDGTRCLRIRRVPYPDPASAAMAEDTQNVLWRLTAASYPLCPRASAPATTPAAQAAEFWRVAGEDLLPRPSPRIAPGFMLAGKLGYLETGSLPSARFDHDTPLGRLVIEATSRTYVDWGDGTPLAGPFDSPGGPWPHGTITHAWTHAGRYDVAVSQRWTGRWRLGADSGELAGLETEGVIEDFEVRQLQAVRNL